MFASKRWWTSQTCPDDELTFTMILSDFSGNFYNFGGVYTRDINWYISINIYIYILYLFIYLYIYIFTYPMWICWDMNRDIDRDVDQQWDYDWTIVEWKWIIWHLANKRWGWPAKALVMIVMWGFLSHGGHRGIIQVIGKVELGNQWWTGVP